MQAASLLSACFFDPMVFRALKIKVMFFLVGIACWVEQKKLKKINKKKKKVLDKAEGFVIHSFSLAAL